MHSARIKDFYLPHQPDLEQKTDYTSYIVEENDVLFGRVCEIYQYEVRDFTDTLIALPDGCAEILFYFSESHIESHLAMIPPEMHKYNLEGFKSVFAIRFVTGWRGNMHNNVPLIQNLSRTLDSNGGSYMYIDSFEAIPNFEKLFRYIVTANTFEKRVECCRDFFGQMLKMEDGQAELARQACLFLAERYGNASISELEDHLGYSSRYIRKIFENYVGYTPKTISEIIKFQHSFYNYYMNPNRSLSDLACEIGYYDLPHMNKSYLKMVKQLPKNLYQEVFAG